MLVVMVCIYMVAIDDVITLGYDYYIFLNSTINMTDVCAATFDTSMYVAGPILGDYISLSSFEKLFSLIYSF